MFRLPQLVLLVRLVQHLPFRKPSNALLALLVFTLPPLDNPSARHVALVPRSPAPERLHALTALLAQALLPLVKLGARLAPMVSTKMSPALLTASPVNQELSLRLPLPSRAVFSVLQADTNLLLDNRLVHNVRRVHMPLISVAARVSFVFLVNLPMFLVHRPVRTALQEVTLQVLVLPPVVLVLLARINRVLLPRSVLSVPLANINSIQEPLLVLIARSVFTLMPSARFPVVPAPPVDLEICQARVFVTTASPEKRSTRRATRCVCPALWAVTILTLLKLLVFCALLAQVPIQLARTRAQTVLKASIRMKAANPLVNHAWKERI
jgi:hypothetical protein